MSVEVTRCSASVETWNWTEPDAMRFTCEVQVGGALEKSHTHLQAAGSRAPGTRRAALTCWELSLSAGFLYTRVWPGLGWAPPRRGSSTGEEVAPRKGLQSAQRTVCMAAAGPNTLPAAACRRAYSQRASLPCNHTQGNCNNTILQHRPSSAISASRQRLSPTAAPADITRNHPPTSTRTEPGNESSAALSSNLPAAGELQPSLCTQLCISALFLSPVMGNPHRAESRGFCLPQCLSSLSLSQGVQT